MIIRLDIKKVGNHWYPCLDHFDPNQVSLDPKLEEILNLLDSRGIQLGCLSIYFKKIDSKEGQKEVLQFNKSDIERYLTTDHELEINTYIDDFHFYVSSELYTLMEQTYKLDFHKNLYKLEIW